MCKINIRPANEALSFGATKGLADPVSPKVPATLF